MSEIIPLISSGTSGPLGVLHLPRLWLKISLAAVGKLHPDYPAIGPGFDQMVIDGLGLKNDDVTAFIEHEKPTYPQFETWVLQQSGGALDETAVKKLNAAIAGYHHDDETRTAILDADSLPDDGKILDAIHLNNLDDWHGFYREIIAG